MYSRGKFAEKNAKVHCLKERLGQIWQHTFLRVSSPNFPGMGGGGGWTERVFFDQLSYIIFGKLL